MNLVSRTAWLASYPKSGNTWVRAQLDALESGDQPDLNGLMRFGTHDRMDTDLAFPLGDLSDAEAAGILRLSWAIGGDRHDGAYVRRKTHRPWLDAADGYPIPWQPTGAKALCIVRDPRAVVASWAHHLDVSLAQAAQIMSETGTTGPINAHGEEGNNSWSTHVTSWLDDCTLPILLVRYEDMIASPEVELARMADFLSIDVTSEQVSDATRSCEFSSLAAREIFEGFSEAAGQGKAFFRRGEADSWKWEVPTDVLDRICHDHGTVMERLGYLT